MAEPRQERARCIEHFDRDGGITTSRQLISGLSALMGDVAAERITNGRANAICNAAGKILTTVKLEQQFGRREGEGQGPILPLIPPASTAPVAAILAANELC